MAGGGKMNVVTLSQSRVERGLDEPVGLNGFDTTRAQLLLNVGDIGLPRGR